MIKIIFCYLILVVFLAISISMIMLMISPIITGYKKAPYVPSFNYHLRLMKKHLKLRKGARLVDLWCGDGKALRFFSKEFGLITEGYEINPFVARLAKLINRLKWFHNIKIIRANLKKAHLDKYDYIYMYLFPNQLIYMEDWIFENIKKDAIIISNSFVFVKHTPFEVIKSEKGKEVIRLYRK